MGCETVMIRLLQSRLPPRIPCSETAVRGPYVRARASASGGDQSAAFFSPKVARAQPSPAVASRPRHGACWEVAVKVTALSCAQLHQQRETVYGRKTLPKIFSSVKSDINIKCQKFSPNVTNSTYFR